MRTSYGNTVKESAGREILDPAFKKTSISLGIGNRPEKKARTAVEIRGANECGVYWASFGVPDVAGNRGSNGGHGTTGQKAREPQDSGYNIVGPDAGFIDGGTA